MRKHGLIRKSCLAAAAFMLILGGGSANALQGAAVQEVNVEVIESVLPAEEETTVPNAPQTGFGNGFGNGGVSASFAVFGIIIAAIAGLAAGIKRKKYLCYAAHTFAATAIDDILTIDGNWR
jgi:hypothetical protein